MRPTPATTRPYMQTPDGSQVEWSSFRLVNYTIYVGWRVGLTGSYLVMLFPRMTRVSQTLSLHPRPVPRHLFRDG
jgi:hypothetical protein